MPGYLAVAIVLMVADHRGGYLTRLRYGLSLAVEPASGAVAWATKHSVRERIERLLNRGADESNATPSMIVAATVVVLVLGVTMTLKSSVSAALENEASLRLSADPFPGAR